jgi:phage tail-like protein
MSTDRLKRYRFKTAPQWTACLFSQVDLTGIRKCGHVGPLPPYGEPARLRNSGGARLPAITSTGETLWIDKHDCVHRRVDCSEIITVSAAPPGMADAKRLVATATAVWALGSEPSNLLQFDAETLTRLLVVEIGDAQVIDIACGDHDDLLVLAARDGCKVVLRVDTAGRTFGPEIAIEGDFTSYAFVYLKQSRRFVVLDSDASPRLHWFSDQGGRALTSRLVSSVRPCFKGRLLDSDSNQRAFLAGADGPPFECREYIVILDGDGNTWGELPIEPPEAPVAGWPTRTDNPLIAGVAARGDSLLVACSFGVLHHTASTHVPKGGHSSCKLVTPLLFSPDREDRRRWLRVEAKAHLPVGSTLEISWVATDKEETKNRLVALAADQAIPASQRLEMLLADVELTRGRTVFHGASQSQDGDDGEEAFAAKLFDVDGRFLWVEVAITTAGGGSLSRLTELEIFYPGRSLMEELPARFRREETQPDNFLRSLVGVLETTTQGLDARIGALGRLINPSSADDEWLDLVARWLGVPWDDALSLDQKRKIVSRAAELAEGRGTRAGLEALLECLFAKGPRQFRVTDATADYGFALVGGPSCPGSTLPAVLAGRPRWRGQLDSTAVLGFTCLPCEGQSDDGMRNLAGKIRIEVAATGKQRRALEPVLLSMLTEMVPLTARIELWWVASRALRSNVLDDTFVLEPAPTTRLGDDAITGQARLPAGRLQINECGPSVEDRLR